VVACAMLYSLGRLAIDSLRDPATLPLHATGLAWTQWVALGTLAAGALALWGWSDGGSDWHQYQPISDNR